MSSAAGLLQGFHVILATRLGPHWMLNDADAKQYGTALANALRHLPITMAQKYIDFSALAIVAFGMEAPRVGITMMQLRQRREGQPPRQPGPARVFQFSPPASGPRPVPQPPHPDMTYEPETGEPLNG